MAPEQARGSHRRPPGSALDPPKGRKKPVVLNTFKTTDLLQPPGTHEAPPRAPRRPQKATRGPKAAPESAPGHPRNPQEGPRDHPSGPLGPGQQCARAGPCRAHCWRPHGPPQGRAQGNPRPPPSTPREHQTATQGAKQTCRFKRVQNDRFIPAHGTPDKTPGRPEGPQEAPGPPLATQICTEILPETESVF